MREHLQPELIVAYIVGFYVRVRKESSFSNPYTSIKKITKNELSAAFPNDELIVIYPDLETAQRKSKSKDTEFGVVEFVQPVFRVTLKPNASISETKIINSAIDKIEEVVIKVEMIKLSYNLLEPENTKTSRCSLQ